MNTAHLFSGAGLAVLTDRILGHTPILAVEKVESCCRSLRERATEGWCPELHVHCGDVRDFDYSPWAGRVDQLAAGFPCQDISAAGRGAGLEGEKSGLVWEVFRAIDALRPGLVFLENSPFIRTRGRREIIAALLERGYSYRDGKLGASDVGAAHYRFRWWLLAANADGRRKLAEYNPPFADLDREHGDMGRLHAGAVSQLEAAGIREGEADASDIDRERWRRRGGKSKPSGRAKPEDSFENASDALRGKFQATSRQPKRAGNKERNEFTHSPQDAADAFIFRL